MSKPSFLSSFIAVGLLVATASFAVAAFPVEPYASTVTPGEKKFADDWLSFILNKGKADSARYAARIPFSFVAGDRSSREWVKVGNARVVSGPWQGTVRKHRLVWKDDKTSLVCEMEVSEFKDFPAFEWLVRIRNEGTADSPKIHDFKALDICWYHAGRGIPTLYRSTGAAASEIDFTFRAEPMRKSQWTDTRKVRIDAASKVMAMNASNNVAIPDDSRPSAVWLPFFNYQTGNDGLLVALGWNGRWFAEFDHKGKSQTTMCAGMEFLDAKLRPGEAIRSQLVMIACWRGEVMHAQNMFRQLLLAHHTPKADGRPVVPPISCITWGGIPSKEHLAAIAKIAEKKIPVDVYWIDAGWYGTGTVPSPSVFKGDWGPMAGDWRVNRKWHPDTLRPVGEAAAKAGMKFLLWAEPERAVQGRPVTLEHPEYFYRSGSGEPKAGQSLLLNLGKTEAMNWAVDTVSGLVEQNKVEWYREDFNLDPGRYWDAADEPDRRGIAEIRFVENLYRFWDTLKERHPSLQMDNCASGGRRLELEAVSRGLTFCRSDYNCFPNASLEAIQDHSFGVSYWLPLEGTFNIARNDISDTYEWRSCLSPGMSMRIAGLELTDERCERLRRHIVEAQRAKEYFSGDYYPLVNTRNSDSSWSAYHFWLPGRERGMLVAIRRPKSDVASMKFELLTIPADGTVWQFENAESGRIQTCTGQQIRENGFEVAIANRRDSVILYYSKAKRETGK